MTERKYRRPLNTEQIRILEKLYKFRFVSTTLLKTYFSESNPGMNVFRRLETLEQQGFIAKRYFDNYRLLHKPVAYHLLPEGIRKLHESKPMIESAVRVKAAYKDKSVSEQFIQDCFDVFSIYLALRSKNIDLKFFTKVDLSHDDYEYFPKPLPDAYMRLKDNQYFLQVHHVYQPFFVATRAVKRYVDYFDNGIWDDTGTDFPVVLFIVDTANIQKRLHKFIAKNVEDLKIYTALKSDVMSGSEKIWQCVDEPDESYSLKELKSLNSA